MKRIILNLMAVLVLATAPVAILTGTAYAADCGTSSPEKSEVLKGLGQTGNDCETGGVTRAIAAAVKILSIVVGAAAIVAIIWSGFKYITSGGDSGKVANAKNTLIYALIGLAVAVLAQLLVNIVITQANKVQCPSGQHLTADGTCVED